MVNMPVCFSRALQTQTPQLQAQLEREPSAGAQPVQLVASVEARLFAYLREVGSGCWKEEGNSNPARDLALRSRSETPIPIDPLRFL
jgi:hypothetical protein